MAEAAVPILRARGLEGKVSILSTYLSHAVYRGVVRGRILSAPTDSPVVQGRLAIEMAVRSVEGRLTVRHAGPPIAIVTSELAGTALIEGSLAPASFVPVFSLEAD
jgi:periplasmic protein TorT